MLIESSFGRKCDVAKYIIKTFRALGQGHAHTKVDCVVKHQRQSKSSLWRKRKVEKSSSTRRLDLYAPNQG